MNARGFAHDSVAIGSTRLDDGPLSTRAKLAAVAGLLLSALALTYWNAIESQFLFDDRSGIVENPAIHDLEHASRRALFEGRGLTDLTFALNYELHGLDVRGYHLVNLGIHFLAALTLFGLARRTLQTSPRFRAASNGLALAVALLWMIHPLQTQAVTYTVQRLESLMGLFYLLTLYCFRRGVDDRDRRWLAVSVLCFALGTRSKEVIFTAPLVVLWYDRAFVATSWREVFSRKFYYGALVAVAALFMGPAVVQVAKGVWSQTALQASTTSTARYGDPSVLSVEGMTPWTYLATQPIVLLRYLRLSILPLGLCFDYGWPVARDAGQIVPAALAVGCLLLATIWGVFRRPGLAFLGGWFFLILLPTSSVVPIQDVAVEHRMYLPLAAVVTLVVLGTYSLLVRFCKPSSQSRCGYAIAIVAVVALGGLTLARNYDYRTNEAMWRDVATKQPDNARAHSNLGMSLIELNRIDEAIGACQTALRLEPTYAYAHSNLGNAHIAQNKLDAAVADYAQAVHYCPWYAAAFNNLGFALSKLDRDDEARRALERALKLKPDYAGAYLNLGLLEAKQNHLDAAQDAYLRAIALESTSAEAHHNLALVLAREQKWRQALEQWDLALAIRPDYAKAHQNAGVVLMRMGEFQGAVEQLREAVRLTPDDVTALRALGDALIASNHTAEARAMYRKVLQIDPKNAAAEVGLATLSLKSEMFDDAIIHFRQALEFAPQEGAVWHELANLLARMGRNDEAVAAYTKAVELLPQSAPVRVNSARLAERMAQPERALQLYQQALAIDATFAPAHCNLGYCLTALQRPDDAVKSFLVAIQLDPTYAEAHFALGNALARAGKLELAIDHYRDVLRLQPGFAPAQQNMQRALETLRGRTAKQTSEGT